MANNAFDQEVLNARERPLSSDINTALSRMYQSLREMDLRKLSGRTSFNSPISTPPTVGFFGDGFLIQPTSPASMGVILKAGFGYFAASSDEPASIGGVVGVDDLASLKPLSLTLDETIAVPGGVPSGQERYDIIEVFYDRRLQDSASRDVFDPVAGSFSPTIVQKTLAWNQNTRHSTVTSPAASTAGIGYKIGIPAAINSAAVPANTAGYVTIARIHVFNSTTSILATNLADFRKLLFGGNGGRVAGSYSVSTLGGGPNLPTVNNLICPPGITPVFTQISGGTATAQLSLYLLGNIASAIISGLAAGGGFFAEASSPTIGTISSGDVTNIGGAASSNPTSAPDPGSGSVLGAPCAKFSIAAGGSIPSTATINFSIDIGY